MSNTTGVDYEQEISDIMQSMTRVNQLIEATGVDQTIYHLVQLRASQLNRCGFCVKMHTRDARQAGETSERLDRVIVWDLVSDFTKQEKAALAWAEALTTLDSRADLQPLRARLREYFSEKEIGVLTSTIAMINLWNRMNISRHRDAGPR